MLRKSIRKEDLKKIKKEILQVLEGERVFCWPGLFEKAWPEGKFSVTDALLEFFSIGVVFEKKVEVSRLRILKAVERIFDNYKEFDDLPFKQDECLTYKVFIQAYLGICWVFTKYTKVVDNDPAGDVEPGQEPGVSY